MMFRSLLVWISLASAGAARIQSLSEDEFGASCDDLQNRFHTQVHTLRVALETRTSESALTQARLAMRMHGIVRTLRRAQECAWVVENDSEDIEEMRGITQGLITGNPCAEAARSELEAGASTDASAALPRAISILMSDDCEAPEIQPVDGDASAPEAELQQAEEELQDSIDEIMDAEDEGESLIQLDQAGRFRRFMRGIGVFFLMLFFLLACMATIAAIVAFLAAGMYVIAVLLTSGGLGFTAATQGYGFLLANIVGVTAGGYVGLPVGLVGCTYQLFTNVHPRLTQ